MSYKYVIRCPFSQARQARQASYAFLSSVALAFNLSFEYRNFQTILPHYLAPEISIVSS